MLAIGVAALVSSPAFAQSSSSSFAVTGTVVVSCTVATGTLAFPNYDSTTDVPATTTTSVRCTGIPANGWLVGYDPGLNSPTNSCVDRNMADPGGNLLNYLLADDPTYSNILGRRGEAGCVNHTMVGVPAGTHTVYGLIRAGQPVPVGSYKDSVIVTVYW